MFNVSPPCVRTKTHLPNCDQALQLFAVRCGSATTDRGVRQRSECGVLAIFFNAGICKGLCGADTWKMLYRATSRIGVLE